VTRLAALIPGVLLCIVVAGVSAALSAAVAVAVDA
jgi:hypothetical protein